VLEDNRAAVGPDGVFEIGRLAVTELDDVICGACYGKQQKTHCEQDTHSHENPTFQL